MKKKLLWMLSLALVGTAYACGDDDDDKTAVDKSFDASLAAKYPGATNVSWEREGSWLVADFSYKSFDMEAWFDTSAKWLQSETDYGPNTQVLPGEIQTAITRDYATWTVDDAARYDRVDRTFYVIDIEKIGERDLDVYYEPDGTLIQAIPDDIDITPSTPVPSV